MKIRFLLILGIISIALAGCESQPENINQEQIKTNTSADYDLQLSEVNDKEDEPLIEEPIEKSNETINYEEPDETIEDEKKGGAIAPEQGEIVDDFSPDYDTSYEGYDDLTYLDYNSALYPVEFALSELCVDHSFYEPIKNEIYHYLDSNNIGNGYLVSLMDSFRKEDNIGTVYFSLGENNKFLKVLINMDDGSCTFDVTDCYELTEFYYGRGEIYKDKHVYCYMDWTTMRMPEKTRTDLKRFLFDFLAENGQIDNVNTLYIDEKFYRGMDNGTLFYYVDDVKKPAWAIKATHDESIGVLKQEIVENFQVFDCRYVI